MIPKNNKETIEDRITAIADEALKSFLPTVIYRQSKDGGSAVFEICRIYPVGIGVYRTFETGDINYLLTGILCYGVITPVGYIMNKFKRK